MRPHTVFLYYCPNCIRHWLAYKTFQGPCTVRVVVMAETGEKAKNAAITAANQEFRGVEIVFVNVTDKLNGIQNYPELEYLRLLIP